MKIFVKGLDGRTVVIYVESSSDTVDSVKAKLEDGHKLSDYNVHEMATMRLLSCHRSPSCSDSMCIYVQKRTSKTMVLQVGPSDTITHVRKKISGQQSLVGRAHPSSSKIDTCEVASHSIAQSVRYKDQYGLERLARLL